MPRPHLPIREGPNSSPEEVAVPGTAPDVALEAFQRAVDALGSADEAGLRRCLRALVPAVGVHGLALVDHAHRRPQVMLRVGDVLTPADLVHAVRGGGHDLRLHVHGQDRPEVRMLALAAAGLLEGRLRLVAGRRRLDEAEARTETLSSAGQALASTLELPEVFAAILGQLRRVVPYDSASVQVLEDRWLHIIGGHGFPNLEEIVGLRFDTTATDNPNRDVVTTGTPLILRDASEFYPSFRKGPHIPANIRGWLGVPLTFGGRTLGMLSIDSRTADFYTQAHARLALAFAAQAAIAIQNARLFDEMRRMATHDALTGLPNRRHVEQVAEVALSHARRHRRALGLLMFDMDRFKDVNDAHGHAVGDEVLCHVARVARGILRPSDVLARFGGEEFVVLLPETDEAGAATLGERLRCAIREAPIPTSTGVLTVTVSVGCVARDPADVSFDHMLRQADRALYRAKAAGRDRLVAA